MDGWILGSPEFAERCRAAAGTSDALRPTWEGILAAVTCAFGVDVEHMRRRGRHDNRAREAAILLMRELLSEPLESVAERFQVSRSAITETVRRARQREKCETVFRHMLEAARREALS